MATNAPTPTRTSYRFDPRAQLYIQRATGQEVSPEEIRRACDTVISSETARARGLSQALLDGQLDRIEWQVQMIALLKRLHVALGLAAAGGVHHIGAGDLGYLGAQMRTQYGYLRRFARQIKNGQQPLNGAVLTRTGLFTQAARGTYEQMMRRNLSDAGYQEESRILGPADHCPTCLEQAARGWQPIGTLNRIGESECLSNCRCRFTFRGGGPLYAVGGGAASDSTTHDRLTAHFTRDTIGATPNQLYEALYGGQARQFGHTLNETYKVTVDGTPYFVKSYGNDAFCAQNSLLSRMAAKLLGLEQHTVPLITFARGRGDEREYYEAQPWLSHMTTYDENSQLFDAGVRKLPERTRSMLILHEFLSGVLDHQDNGGNYLTDRNGTIYTTDFELAYGDQREFAWNLLAESAVKQGLTALDTTALAAVLHAHEDYLALARTSGLRDDQLRELERRFTVLQQLAREHEQPTVDDLAQVANQVLAGK